MNLGWLCYSWRQTNLAALLQYISRDIMHHSWELALPWQVMHKPWRETNEIQLMQGQTKQGNSQCKAIGQRKENPEFSPYDHTLGICDHNMPFLGSCQYTNIIHWPHLLQAKNVCRLTCTYTKLPMQKQQCRVLLDPLPYSPFIKTKGHKYGTIWTWTDYN